MDSASSERALRRVLIIGHGVAGQSLAAELIARGDEVVGFLDDQVTGPEVLGRLSDVNAVLLNADVDLICFAIPSVDAGMLRRFISSIDNEQVEIAIIPRTYQILSKDSVRIEDLTDIDVLDLVGRRPVKHDLLEASRFIDGKRVMVTGAAGSIGSRLVEQLASMSPAEIVCVDWWENGMFFLGERLGGEERIHLCIGDVKDVRRMDALFRQFEPQMVFHAAAYKHVPLMQQNPTEAINNNVGGTVNLMRLAMKHEVENFIYVSTDKAVNPANVMGATKRIGELVMKTLARESSGTRFAAVRFGNVIQSNGSVMQIFRKQITDKSPLTVTHPDVTRFFMTIDEACQLIIQSAILAGNGDICVLDMGEPVRIMDLAESLVKAVDPSLQIEITGLRPGEKMYEELSYAPESVTTTKNQKVFVLADDSAALNTVQLRDVDSLLQETRSQSISPVAVVERLRSMGFAVQ